MPFWLTNPLHGVMPVYTSGDVEKHKGLGWTLLNHGESPNLPPKPARPVQSFPALPGESPQTPLTASVGVFNTTDQAAIAEALEKRKPGRPPKAK